ncbi:hypothetical protein HGA91_06005 [candidate division WWE3 bacterium]|nr:hypothetical protein [candidate division WWE3 bacterium]
MSTNLVPTLQKVFPPEWVNQIADETLKYALCENQNFRVEVDKWLSLFDKKGWLTDGVINRLRRGNHWPGYYSKINEFRVGYFVETMLGLQLIEYESPTIRNKNVEFKCVSINEQMIYVEVKTPLNLERFGLRPQTDNNSDLIYSLLRKASVQLSDRKPSIVVLADDLNFPLLIDRDGQHYLESIFKDESLRTISAVCFMGGIFIETMYSIVWAINPHAAQPIDENLFIGFMAMDSSVTKTDQ